MISGTQQASTSITVNDGSMSGAVREVVEIEAGDVVSG